MKRTVESRTPKGKVKILHGPPMCEVLTVNQRILKKKHGTPAEFAVACYKSVPAFISMGEARAAIAKYQREWDSDPLFESA